jgi:outer membrane protein assembly factor BamB
LLQCLNAVNGTLLWAHDIIKEYGGHLPTWLLAMSPKIDGDRVIVTPGGKDAAVVVLDKKTGAKIWQGGGNFLPSYSTPVVAVINGVKQYIVFTARDLIGMDAADGHLLWNYPWTTAYDINGAVPIVDGNKLIITSGYGHGCALLEITAQGVVKLWETKELPDRFSTPLLRNGFIYGIGDTGHLVCLDEKDGRKCWDQPGFGFGSVIGLDEAFIALNGDNGDLTLVKFDSAAYQELGRVKPLGGQSWTAPIIANGKLYIRNTKQLACLEIK